MEDENWPKYEKRNWPTGSLERQLRLNYPGCKNLNEAIQVQRLRDQIKAADKGALSGKTGDSKSLNESSTLSAPAKEIHLQNDTASQTLKEIEDSLFPGERVSVSDIPMPHQKKDDIGW